MISEKTIEKAFHHFTLELEVPFHLRGIFFDMDGVLYNSMPYHAQSWIQTFSEFKLRLPEFEPYMNEGSTALFTVQQMFKKYLHREATSEECEQIRQRKHEVMAAMPPSEIFPAMKGLLEEIHQQKIHCWVVTGSAQESLINRLVEEFNGILRRDQMITAHDVIQGKPHPEPYLKAMQRSGFMKHQALVIENAPLGVRSAKAAGLFTIAVNTGPIHRDVLLHAGADLVFGNIDELKGSWSVILKLLSKK
ncbi:MAG: HAD family phosphatase [Prolixibacteraceae bacterium]|nr:HAD family phosphatase [Prolixibacteraceae bacterium]